MEKQNPDSVLSQPTKTKEEQSCCFILFKLILLIIFACIGMILFEPIGLIFGEDTNLYYLITVTGVILFVILAVGINKFLTRFFHE